MRMRLPLARLPRPAPTLGWIIHPSAMHAATYAWAGTQPCMVHPRPRPRPGSRRPPVLTTERKTPRHQPLHRAQWQCPNRWIQIASCHRPNDPSIHAGAIDRPDLTRLTHMLPPACCFRVGVRLPAVGRSSARMRTAISSARRCIGASNGSLASAMPTTTTAVASGDEYIWSSWRLY